MTKRFIERTLVVIKPDAVQRGLVGPIIERFERAGLKIIGLKFLQPIREQLDKHFPIHNESWIRNMGEKSLQSYKANDMDSIKELGTDDPMEIGMVVLKWNYKFMLSGPVCAIALEGPRAVAGVRKLIGDTIPANAALGTIRGDFSICSADYSNEIQHSLRNLVHASESVEEAKRECSAWFTPDELLEYKKHNEQVIY